MTGVQAMSRQTEGAPTLATVAQAAGVSRQTVSNALNNPDLLLRSAAVDAFVITDTFRGNPHAAWLREQDVPFVAFGRPWDDPTAGHPWVDVDGRAGIVLAVDHLVERGHARIA